MDMKKICTLLLAVLASCGAWTARAADPPSDPRQLAAAQLEEAQAHHIGTLAYLYGLPMVDLVQNMYLETRRIDGSRSVQVPINQFYRSAELVTPATSAGLRAPNSDTLYLRGWFDLKDEPIVIRAPDTAGRYYTLAITDFRSEVQHVGRRTTGTRQRDFVLVGPGFQGELPDDLAVVRLPTHQVWILGRVLVRGPPDLAAASAVLTGFEAVPLAQWRQGVRRTPAAAELPIGEPWRPTETLEFFAVLNWWLRDNPRVAAEEALLAQFDAIGFGPDTVFDAGKASEATRRGLLRAIDDARAMLRAASRRPLTDVRNGWMFPLALGRYGYDYLLRATVVFGGYANLPEETVYAALTADSQGRPLTGERDYLLRFPAGARPPVGAFWSLSAYRNADFSFMENAAGRYSVGDHFPDFRTAADGSFVVRISKRPPSDPAENWLPVGDGPFYLIMRLYEPGPAVLDGRYAPPAIE